MTDRNALIAQTLNLRLPEMMVVCDLDDDYSVAPNAPLARVSTGSAGRTVITISEPGVRTDRLAAHAARLIYAAELGQFERLSSDQLVSYTIRHADSDFGAEHVVLTFQNLDCSTALPTDLVPIRNGDPDRMHYAYRQIVGELADAIGEERAAQRLQTLLGDDTLGDRLPAGISAEIVGLRDLLTQWACQEMDAVTLIDRAHALLFGEARAA